MPSVHIFYESISLFLYFAHRNNGYYYIVYAESGNQLDREKHVTIMNISHKKGTNVDKGIV